MPTPLAGGQRKFICSANDFSLASGQGGGQMMMMMMMTQFLPITTENHTFILGSEFKYGAQVTIHALGFTNSAGILLKCDANTWHKYETTDKTNTRFPQI